MHVTGDRAALHGLSTIGYYDEGVAGQSWHLIKDGVLVAYQLDRRMARLENFGRSNSCAFADSPGHLPLQRMADVSLESAAGAIGQPTSADRGNSEPIEGFDNQH